MVAALGVALVGALVERLLLKRLYAAPELLQLTATFAVVLIVRDAVLAIFGAEDLLGPRAPGLSGTVEVLGRAVPEYDLFLIVVGPAVLVALTWLVTRTRFGVLIRAASENLFVAASAVGRQLVMLEDSLGAPLLERRQGRGKVRLTAAGRCRSCRSRVRRASGC